MLVLEDQTDSEVGRVKFQSGRRNSSVCLGNGE